MTTEKTVKPEKERENNNYGSSRQNRDFGRHDIYMPKNINNSYRVYTGGNNNYNSENKFRFKNSLIVTPNYEIEFNGTGGLKYIKNHDDRIFFTGGNLFFRTNNIQKMPVLLKRGINKLSNQKKLVVGEKYNYEEKYEVNQNIILYYGENRLDFQVMFKKSDPQNSIIYHNDKDITTEFCLNLSVPELDDSVAYKKYTGDEEYKNFISKLANPFYNAEFGNSDGFDRDLQMLDNIEYIIIKCGRSEDLCMTVYPDRKQFLKYNNRNKSIGFTVPNLNQEKTYINLRIYLEKYKIV